jgi:acyl-CoA synthetase (AMP-forming)/AMP-acid ligase II
MYTSGTTGKPKACQLTQKNFLANTANAHLELGMGEKDVYLHCSPIFYISSIWTPILALYAKFMQIYGMTEILISHALPHKEHLDAAAGGEKAEKILRSCGRPFINCDSIIIDDNGNSLEAGEIGEIAVRSQTLMLGYCNETEAGDAWAGEYVKTGDLGYKDENGYFYIVDRKKDIIISGAEKISSRDVEEVLAGHPSVLEAAVIGIPDERWGESVRGIVVLKPDAQRISEQELMDFCGERLGRFKRPKSIIYVDQLPRNASGKVLKQELKKTFSS